jgi:hypothetical protein
MDIMHHSHGSSRNIDMGVDMDIEYYWTGAFGHNYAKVRYYMYIGIVIRQNFYEN